MVEVDFVVVAATMTGVDEAHCILRGALHGADMLHATYV